MGVGLPATLNAENESCPDAVPIDPDCEPGDIDDDRDIDLLDFALFTVRYTDGR